MPEPERAQLPKPISRDRAAEAALAAEMAAARACTLCAAHLPLGPRPVLRGRAGARLLIVGQAPGTRVHASGTPWDDPSGDRLRAWLGLDRAAFYDEARIAILPMGMCYPGRLPRGGDAPPRPECAPLWHPRLRPLLARLRLTLLVGSYAQAFYLGTGRGRTLAATVQGFARYAPDFFPLPHPSWRTRAWAARHAWFEAEVIPALRRAVAKALAEA
ncbi:MAG: uracil-DNA glycosylase family protein [Alphaproteobacteria bacterium]|nr:uracil-DNA glycosylase family protein [Alphaproteobacteria bacterium]